MADPTAPNVPSDMPALVLVFASLAHFCSAEIDRKDLNCTQPVQSAATYSMNATFCNNFIPDYQCQEIFGESKVASYGYEARPVMCWSNDGGLTLNEENKKVAIAYCAKHCGYCCQTKAYTSCSNKPNPELQCSYVTESMCKSTTWRAKITEDCPSSCGFCCYDESPSCSSMPNICSQDPDYAAKNCKRSCGLCGVEPTTVTIPISCVDHEHCQFWIANGFCSQTFYTQSQKRTQCPVGCGFCPGK